MALAPALASPTVSLNSRARVQIVYNCGRGDDPASTERLRRLARSILRRCAPEEIVAANPDWQVVNAWSFGDLGARLRRQRLDAHAQHERADMSPADTKALAEQLVAQHPGAHEGVLQMQLVDLAHQHQIGRADRLGQVQRSILHSRKSQNDEVHHFAGCSRALRVGSILWRCGRFRRKGARPEG